MIILHNGAPITAITPGSTPVYVPGFGVEPVEPQNLIRGLPVPWLQIQAEGADVGPANPRVLNVVADPELLHVTRGVGENAHVVTLMKLGGPSLYWDPDNHSTDITLSDGNRVATGFFTGTNTNRGVRGITSKAVGDTGYFEIALAGFAPNSANGYVGIAAATWTAPYENVPGLDAAYKGWTFATNGYLYHDGFLPTHMNGDPNNWNNLPGQPGTRVMILVDRRVSPGVVYFGTDGVWRFGADPEAGTGGLALTTSLVWPAANMFLGASLTRVATLYSAANETLHFDAAPSWAQRWEGV